MNETKKQHAVTGAFGYSGKYITTRLLSEGKEVITLTNSKKSNPFGDKIQAYPFNFDNPDKLAQSLQNTEVLYNTYWVRFNQKNLTFNTALKNSLILINAAKQAGVKRIVHVSITNPSEDSPLEYFSGKAKLEKAIIESGISYAILRPTILFGKEDILINNTAWMLRRLPVFGAFGDGNYKVQPIYVDDLAKLAVECGESNDNVIINAIGPETFTYREMVNAVGDAIGIKRPILSSPPFIGYWFTRFLGFFVKDMIVTKDEIVGLMSNLLYVESPPAGETAMTEWMRNNASELGMVYANQVGRRTIG